MAACDSGQLSSQFIPVFIEDRDRLACLVTFAQARFTALTVMAGLVLAIHVVQLRRRFAG
jgi:hypothetical protein